MATDELIPTLSTARLILRGVGEDDIDAIERHFTDYEVVRHLSAQIAWPQLADGVRNFVVDDVLPNQGRDRWVWGLHLKERPGLIGAIDLWRECKPDNRGFWLGRPFWGRGYMTEAATRVTDFAFDELGFERLVLTNALGNRRSRAIKERTGAMLIGVAPANFVDPVYSQHELWEITKEEWRRFRSEAR